MRRRIILLLVLVLLLYSGCVLIKSDPIRLVKDLVIYGKAKECKSEKLDLVIYARHPIKNPEEEIWIKDIRIDMTLRREAETVTVTRYHDIEIDQKTGKALPRSFYDFPDMQLIGEDLGWKKKPLTNEELLKIFKDILSDRQIYLHEREYLMQLRRELQTEYSNVVERCLYGFKY